MAATREESRDGFLRRALARLLMRPARVARVDALSAHFRLIHFEGEALKGAAWSPGDKLQIAVDDSFRTRTYAPIGWDGAGGRTRVLVHCPRPAPGPGSDWALQATAGEQRAVVGPRRSLPLADLAGPVVVFGDETSLGLAAGLQLTRRAKSRCHHVFEVHDHAEAAAAADAVGMSAVYMIERKLDGTHAHEVADRVLRLARPDTTFVLSGKASSILHLARALKGRGVENQRLRAKAHWAPDQAGLE